jgi:hypothetical protein
VRLPGSQRRFTIAITSVERRFWEVNGIEMAWKSEDGGMPVSAVEARRRETILF